MDKPAVGLGRMGLRKIWTRVQLWCSLCNQCFSVVY